MKAKTRERIRASFSHVMQAEANLRDAEVAIGGIMPSCIYEPRDLPEDLEKLFCRVFEDLPKLRKMMNDYLPGNDDEKEAKE